MAKIGYTVCDRCCHYFSLEEGIDKPISTVDFSHIQNGEILERRKFELCEKCTKKIWNFLYEFD